MRSSRARKEKVSYNTLTINKNIKNIKYKIKHKYEMMLGNKYYLQLMFSDKRKNRNMRKVKDDTGVGKRKKSNLDVRKISTKLSPKIDPTSSPVAKVKEFNLLDNILSPEM